MYVPKVHEEVTKKGAPVIPEVVDGRAASKVQEQAESSSRLNARNVSAQGVKTPPEQGGEADFQAVSKGVQPGTPLNMPIQQSIVTPNQFNNLASISEDGEIESNEDDPDGLAELKGRKDVEKQMKHTKVLNTGAKKKNQKRRAGKGGRKQLDTNSPVGDFPQL